jgi:hypothetical protein
VRIAVVVVELVCVATELNSFVLVLFVVALVCLDFVLKLGLLASIAAAFAVILNMDYCDYHFVD